MLEDLVMAKKTETPNSQPTNSQEEKMEAHTSDGGVIRIEQVIATGLVGNKNFMQEQVIKNGPADILRITGFANEHVTIKKSNNNNNNDDSGRPTTYIKGAFNGENLFTKEKYLSGQLILPDSASGYVCANIDMNGPLDIDIVIRVERAEKSIVGYKFAALLHKLDPRNKKKQTTTDGAAGSGNSETSQS